jgi:2'-5' RNA ligase
VRLFVAIELPEDVRALLAAAAERLRASEAAVKWVAPANLHLTVKFLGEAEEARLPEIVAALERAARGAGPLEARVSGAGAFPSAHRPRVVWAGLDAGAALPSLVDAVERALAPLGFPREERPWSAHVTLGRVREERGRRGGGRDRRRGSGDGGVRLADLLLAERGLSSPPFRIEALTLFESVLSREGPAYTARGRTALAGER